MVVGRILLVLVVIIVSLRMGGGVIVASVGDWMEARVLMDLRKLRGVNKMMGIGEGSAKKSECLIVHALMPVLDHHVFFSR